MQTAGAGRHHPSVARVSQSPPSRHHPDPTAILAFTHLSADSLLKAY
jgi:hypothetical protein